jgi:hypothetical protein
MDIKPNWHDMQASGALHSALGEMMIDRAGLLLEPNSSRDDGLSLM